MKFTEPKRLFGGRLKGRLTNVRFNNVVIHPDGQQIAFSLSSNQVSAIGIVDREGKNTKRLTRPRLTESGKQCDDAYWYLHFTPDGKQLLYSFSEDDGTRHSLRLLDLATTEETCLTPTRLSPIQISPDGHYVICVSWDTSANLCQVSMTSGEITFLTHSHPPEDGLGERDTYPDNLHPRYSPDGTRIAFLSSDYDGKVNDKLQVCTMRSDGTDMRCLTNFPGNCGKPVWHPNGQQIAFTVQEELDASTEQKKWKYRLNIYQMDADGSHLRRLENSNSVNHAVSYSPDGRYLTYATSGEERFAERKRNWDIRLLDTTDGTVYKITDDDLYDHSPMFHPDAMSVLFLSERDGCTGLYEVHIDSDLTLEERSD